MAKPADFLLGILDFFAVLLPGAIAAQLLAVILPQGVRDVLLLRPLGFTDATGWAVFFLAAYVSGHLLFQMGSKLDPSYDRWRRRKHPSNRDKTFLAADELRKTLTRELGDSPFSTLKWAMSYIQIHSPASRVEIERLMATSKFFRSLVIVWAVLSVSFFFRGELPAMLACVVLTVLSYQRYCDQRWKASELSYATAVILHRTMPSS